MKNLLFFPLLLLALKACGNPSSQKVLDTLAAPAVTEKEYTLDEDIGMMLLVGFRGTEVDSAKNPEIVTALRDYHVGSVILFDYDASTGQRGRNIKDTAQVRRLCAQLRCYNPQLLIGIDQEGGYVSRLAPRHGFPRIPSAKRLGAMREDSLRYYANLTGQSLAALGINLNFAPVADVDINPRCPVIGAIERSFSDNANKVASCCGVWMDVVSQTGVVSCMKHFPGHGSATGDTHKGLVDVTDTWQRSELIPYMGLSQAYQYEKHTMVMTAHVVNRQLDPTGLPASLSPRITSLLRDTLGFDGVIVTDDMAMGAITSQYGFEQAIRMAVLAGADLLCLSNNGGTYDPTMVACAARVVRQMVDDGTIDEQRIRCSAQRMRRLL